jgi:hypothetical protein
LTIPSGILKLYNAKLEITEESIIFRDAYGYWEGKLAGLLGGKSGCVQFNATPTEVSEGVYLAKGHPYNSPNSYEAYWLRKALHQAISPLWREEASEVARLSNLVVNGSGWLGTDDEYANLKDWQKLMIEWTSFLQANSAWVTYLNRDLYLDKMAMPKSLPGLIRFL